MDAPCPPGELCEDPIDWVAVVSPIAVGLIGLGLTFGIVLQPSRSQPLFVPHRRSLSTAIMFGVIALVMFAIAASFPLLAWPAFGSTVAAFFLGGTALRPRGSRLRGLLLGVLVYLLSGVVGMFAISGGRVDQLVGDLSGAVYVVLAWPGFLFAWFSGYIG